MYVYIYLDVTMLTVNLTVTLCVYHYRYDNGWNGPPFEEQEEKSKDQVFSDCIETNISLHGLLYNFYCYYKYAYIALHLGSLKFYLFTVLSRMIFISS